MHLSKLAVFVFLLQPEPLYSVPNELLLVILIHDSIIPSPVNNILQFDLDQTRHILKLTLNKNGLLDIMAKFEGVFQLLRNYLLHRP